MYQIRWIAMTKSNMDVTASMTESRKAPIPLCGMLTPAVVVAGVTAATMPVPPNVVF